MQTKTRISALAIPLLTLCIAGLRPGAAGAIEAGASAAAASSAIPAPESRIDINHATADELMKAPGMTRSWAERIVRFRPYRSKQDLLDKGVVSSEVYDRIKNYVIAHRDKQ